VSQFKYLGRPLKNQNLIQEEIKRRLNFGNACCRSVQSLLSSRLLSNNARTKIHRTTILHLVLYDFETSHLTFGEEHRLKVFENRVLSRIFRTKRDNGEEFGEDCLMRSFITSTLRQV
jgi:hypothetical protein